MATNDCTKERLSTGCNKKRTKTINRSLENSVKKHQDAYRDFVNATIEEVASQFVQPSDEGLEPPSQIGASTWTSIEKEIFFQKLPLLGRDNTKEIAAAIGSKSEFEVHQYILLLSEGVVEGNLTHDLDAHLATNIPAASEISGECEAVLEVAADVLSRAQLQLEKEREKKKYGDHWLLTDEVAEEIEKAFVAAHMPRDIGHDTLKGAEEGEIETLPVPAAGLLNLPKWLEISKHFMWQSQEGSENWTDFVTSEDHTPSMYNTAFQDFHNLTVSLTRRLIQATIFQTQCRLRAKDRKRPSAKVYFADVRAAARVLGVKTDRKRFWGTMPRRHGINVYVRKDKRAKKESIESSPGRPHYRRLYHMSYDEVEAALGVGSKEDALPDEDASETVEDDSGLLDTYDDSDVWTEVSIDSNDLQAQVGEIDSDDDAPDYGTFQPSDHEGSSQTHRARRMGTRNDTRTLEKQLDIQADTFDRQSSAIEEAQLWSLLGLAQPTQIKHEDKNVLTTLPMKRKTKSELHDWRDGISYEAEWERDTGLASQSEFLAMQNRGLAARKKRKLSIPAHLSVKIRLTRRSKSDSPSVRSDSPSKVGADSEDDINPSPARAVGPADYETIRWSPTGTNAAQHNDPLTEPRHSKHASVSESPAANRDQVASPQSTKSFERRSSSVATQALLAQLSGLRTTTPAPVRSESLAQSTHEKAETPHSDTDEEMVDASEASSDSDIDVSRAIPVLPKRTDPDTDSDGQEEGWMADIRRKEREAQGKDKVKKS
ncbi:hypothetical protein BDV97DRAFT_360685 [Delphinella strobiligena]|nr:hypothetical protein BDV97DRAFT_360685 [Delphinella strobiligena]